MMDDNRVLLDDGDEIPLVPVKGTAASSASPVAPAPAAVAAVPKPLPVFDQLLSETKEEKSEIVAIVAASPDAPTFSAAVTAPVTLDNAVDEAIAAAEVKLSDDDMRRRFRMLVSLFFRDLRDALETKSKFTMPVASGGMGFSESVASAAISGMETRRKAYLAGESSRAADAKAAYVAVRAETHMADDSVRDQAESAARDLTHGKLMEASGLAAPGSLVIPPPATPPKVIPVVGLSSPKTIDLIVPPAPVASPAPTPSPIASAMPVMPPPPEARFEPPPNLPVAPAPEPVVPPPVMPAPPVIPPAPVVAPAPMPVMPPPVVPVAPAPVVPPPPRPLPPPVMPAQSARPTMSDIQAAPRLTGPVEELRAVTLVDFRRLSKEPREATLKLKDKIDLLSDVGFEEKARGIKAWTESPVNKLYLDILRSSLEGRPVMDVIAEMDTKGIPTLLKAEFDALMELNRRLRFG